MKVTQLLKKVLRSALIFVMVLSLTGTALAKELSTYGTFTSPEYKIEHVWADDENPEGINTPKEGTELEHTIKTDSWWDHGHDGDMGFERGESTIATDDLDVCHWEYQNSEVSLSTSVDGADTNDQLSGQLANQINGDKAAQELLEKLAQLQELYNAIPEAVENPVNRYDDKYYDMEAYQKAMDEYNSKVEEYNRQVQKCYEEEFEYNQEYQKYINGEREDPPEGNYIRWPSSPSEPYKSRYFKNSEYNADCAAMAEEIAAYKSAMNARDELIEDYEAFVNEIYRQLRWGNGNEDASIAALLEKYPDWNDLEFGNGAGRGSWVVDRAWSSIREALENPNKFLGTGSSGGSVERYNEIKDNVKQSVLGQLETIEMPQFITSEEIEKALDAIANEIGERTDVGRVVGSADVWSTGTIGNGHWALSKNTNPIQLTEESEQALKDQGYEYNSLRIEIAVIRGVECAQDNWRDIGYRKTYVSTDNGETWTLSGVVDSKGNDISDQYADEMDSTIENPVGDDEVVESYLYTYLHVKNPSSERTGKEPKPDPKPDPKPGPKPGPDPDPDPDPVIPVIPVPEDPSEEIPAPEVPLAEPEVPEEPEVEEPLEEIDEPDVPLADIPETGDISGLWYAAALLAAAGLAALLCQDRRSRKTA